MSIKTLIFAHRNRNDMNIKTDKVAVIGSGSWATAISKMLLENVAEINWFFRKKETIDQFKSLHYNPRYLQSVEFETDRIRFFNDINEIFLESDIIVLAIPSAFLPRILSDVEVDISNKYFLSGVKGVVTKENLLVAEYLNKYFNVFLENIGIIAGPCHAEEVVLEKMSYLTLASLDMDRAESFANLIRNDYISVSISDDIWGTEYTSIIKNIIAIGAGIAHGLRYGDNFQAALVSNAIHEIKRFVDAVHPIKREIIDSAYLGDLIVTVYSQFSRNRTFGTMIGKGYSVKSAILDMNMIAEGYFASRSIYEINQKYNVDMPISSAVYRILYENAPFKKEMTNLSQVLS